MGWWLVGAVVGVGVLVWLAVVVVDYLPAGPVPVSPAPPVAVEAARRWTAKEILGYRDLGGRRIPPTHPATRGAGSSAEALAVWDALGSP